MPLAWFISAFYIYNFATRTTLILRVCKCAFVRGCAWVYVCVSICLPLSVSKCDPECIVYVCVWHNFLPIFFHNLNQRKCINFAGVRGAYIEPVNKSILLLPTMPCQVHTSSQHIIINCTLNHSVQLTMWEWMERERYRERKAGEGCAAFESLF